MKYVVDDKKLDAVPFIAFVNQVWQGSYDVEKTQGALSKTINIACVFLQTDIISARLQS